MKITKSDFSEAKHSNMKLQKGKDSQEAAYLHFRTLHFEYLNHRQEATCAPLKKMGITYKNTKATLSQTA